jgi:hypothetical protein
MNRPIQSPPSQFSAGTFVNSIAYNVLSTDDGWRIETRFPSRVPASDKAIVLKSLEDYRHQVRRVHPQWDLSITVGKDVYLLDIKRTKNLNDLFNRVQEKVLMNWGEY